MYDVVLSPCPDYRQEHCLAALEAALTPIGGLDWVKPGMRVGIKANLVAAMKPETAVTTHPALLGALSQLLRQRGAVPVIGDSPGNLFNGPVLHRVYHTAGLTELDAELNENFDTLECEFPQAAVCKTFTATAWLKDCDGIINFCKLKSHGMMGLSGAAKNLFGTIPGTMKPEYHFRFPDAMDFGRMIVDLDEYWKPQLHLVDAVVAMEGNGPTAGTPRPVGCVLAGRNPHSLDLLLARLIGLPPAEIPTLAAALERNLCPGAAEELSILGPWQDFVQPGFETVAQRSGLQFQNVARGRAGALFSSFLQRSIAPRPQVEAAACIGCAKCAGICPAKAITMRRKLPQIDRSACIRCFCCQEFCPKGAMKVKRPPLARLLT